MSWKKLFRRKLIDRNEIATELHRVLSTLDLTLLGIGSTLGTGIYVLAGQVAKMDAGPAVVISFLIAAIASVLAGLCYAEFGARVPKAGSAYVYSYVCVGEIIAFIVGWNLVMEYVIGVASVSKAYSGYVDSIIPGHAMSNAFKEVGTIHVSFLAEYFDFFAFGITVVLTLLLMFGVKESSVFNNIFTVLNLLVMFFVIIAGGLYSSFDNWNVDPLKTMECKNISSHTIARGDIGKGGFTPFGFTGIMAGAATCFYGFIGFDVIATTGEEAKNPKRAIPISIVLSLLFIFVAYFGISTVLTMMVPYYCQYEDAPLPYAFEYKGFIIGKWIVNIGALFALATSLLGSMFPMPRIIYSMARDGLLFNFLAKVHPRFQTPMWATLIGGLLGAIMGALFNLSSLIDMMSIGTLTAYTLVALCVLMLRYRKDESGADDTSFDDSDEPLTLKKWFRQSFNFDNQKVPTKLSTQYTTATVVIYCILCFAFCATAISAEQSKEGLTPEIIAILGVLGVLLFLEMVSLAVQPVSRLELSFRVPLVPWIPGLSILVNTYLILELSWETWVRFAIWMVVGLVIYLYCLFTGRADRTYNAAYEEYQNNKKLESSIKPKPSLHGIDNPALVYEHEESTLHKEKPQSKTDHDSEASKEQPFGQDVTDNVQMTKSILVNSHQKIQDSVQKSEAIMTKDDPILKIHESNKKYMSVPHENPPPRTPEEMVDSVIFSAMLEAEAMKKKYPQEAKKLVNQVISAAEQQDTLQLIHKSCQQCLNESNVNAADNSPPILSTDADREETHAFLQDHLRKSLIKSVETSQPPSAVDQSEGTNTMEDMAKRLEYIHTVAQLCLNGVNIDSIPWLLEPPSNSKAVPSQQPENGEDETSPSAPLEEVISQLNSNGVNIESIPWPIDQALITDADKEITKELNRQLVRESESQVPVPSTNPPAPTSEQLAETLRIHENAQKVLRMPREENDEGKVEDEEPQQNSQVEETTTNISPSVSFSGDPKIIEIHNKAQEVLLADDSPAEPISDSTTDNIHRIAQLCLRGVNIDSVQWLAPAVSSNDEREQIKQLNKRLMESANNSQENPLLPQDISPPPPFPPEQMEKLLKIHNTAQETLRASGENIQVKENKENDSVPNLNIMDELPDHSTPESTTETIHKIAQLSLRGINSESVYWLDPVFTSDEERQQIKDLNQRMMNKNNADENISPSKNEASPPPPFSPEQQERLAQIHNAAQEILRVKTPVAAQPVTENIHLVAQFALRGLNSGNMSWLAPVLSSNEERQQIKDLNQRLMASANKPEESVKPTISPPSLSAEQTAQLLKVHNDIQEALRVSSSKNNAANQKQNEGSPSEPADVERIHKITQLCLSGISVPWLLPKLTSDQEKEQIKALNKRATEEAFRKANLKEQPIQKDPRETPLSPTNSKSARKRLTKIHTRAQESLRGNQPKSSEESVLDTDESDEEQVARQIPGKKISVSFSSPPKIEDIIAAGSNSEDEADIPKRKLQNRRPTGPFLPQLGKLKLSHSQSDLSENDDDEEDLNSLSLSQSDLLKNNDEPQVATPRKQSIQNKKAMDDLIAIFEQGK